MNSPWVRAAVAAAATLVVAGCALGSGKGSSEKLVEVVGNPVQGFAGLPGVSTSRHADIGSMILCSKATHTLRVTSVKPVGLMGKITVVDFRTRPNPFTATPKEQSIGTDYGTLESLGMTSSSRDLVPCGNAIENAGSEVALELEVHDHADAVARGWEFTVSDGHATSTITYPQGVVLCSEPAMESPRCAHLWENTKHMK